MKRAIFFILLLSLLPLLALLKSDASPLWLLSTILLGLSAVWINATFTHRKLRVVFNLLFVIVIHLINSAYSLSFIIQNEGFNSAFFYHLRPDIVLGAISDYQWLLVLQAVHWVALIACGISLSFIKSQKQKSVTQRLGATALATLSLLIWSPAISIKSYLSNYVFENTASDETVESILKKIESEPPRFSSLRKPNLVFLYLEGVEQTYFDLPDHPELMKNLREIKMRSIDFTDVTQVAGTNFTMGGIVASQCGLPLISPYLSSDHNASAPSTSFMQNAICLGEIFKSKGYYQAYFGGADLRFAGKEYFFRSRGYDEVLGKIELRDQLKDPKNMQPWGLWDEDLFSILFEKFKVLSKAEQPFVLSALTVDTHPPRGTKSASCETYGGSDNEMLISVHCADQLVARFIKEVRASEYSKDTVIVVMSDHLMMHSDASTIIKQSGVERKLTFFINFHDGRTETITNEGTHFDVPATVMDAMNFAQTGQFGLGQSLLQGTGFLASQPEGFQLLTNTKLRDYVKSLWHSPSDRLDERGLRLERITDNKNGSNGHRLRLGEADFNLTFQGIWDTAETLIKIDPETYEILDYQTFYDRFSGLTESGLSRLALKSPYDHYILIGRNYFLRGLVDLPNDKKLSIYVGSPASDHSFVADIHRKPLTVSFETIQSVLNQEQKDTHVAEKMEKAYPAERLSHMKKQKEWLEKIPTDLIVRACSFKKCESEIVVGNDETISVPRGLNIYSLDDSFSIELVDRLDHCSNNSIFEQGPSLEGIVQKSQENSRYLVMVTYDTVTCAPGKSIGLENWVKGYKLPELASIRYREPYIALVDVQKQEALEIFPLDGSRSFIEINRTQDDATVTGL